jgi:hypothetical protein
VLVTAAPADTRSAICEDILRAADICLDHGVFIETGPHKHAIQQTLFLCGYEPGGNRIELCNPVARLVLAPAWRTITWTQAERAKGQAWGLEGEERPRYRSAWRDGRDHGTLSASGAPGFGGAQGT